MWASFKLPTSNDMIEAFSSLQRSCGQGSMPRAGAMITAVHSSSALFVSYLYTTLTIRKLCIHAQLRQEVYLHPGNATKKCTLVQTLFFILFFLHMTQIFITKYFYNFLIISLTIVFAFIDMVIQESLYCDWRVTYSPAWSELYPCVKHLGSVGKRSCMSPHLIFVLDGAKCNHISTAEWC